MTQLQDDAVLCTHDDVAFSSWNDVGMIAMTDIIMYF